MSYTKGMQTFLPYADFHQSVQALDYRRLGKQRVEAMQLVNSTYKLARGLPVKGWANHPARNMWDGYMDALKLYHNVCIQEWLARGYNNTMQLYDLPKDVVMPPWIGDERVHRSHRSNLLRKDPVFYSQFNWLESPDIPYYWPVS
jgi:hypothetical protein